jgi:hypothetical protein
MYVAAGRVYVEAGCVYSDILLILAMTPHQSDPGQGRKKEESTCCNEYDQCAFLDSYRNRFVIGSIGYDQNGWCFNKG